MGTSFEEKTKRLPAAAKRGNACAQRQLAWRKLIDEPAEAVFRFRKAAEQGDTAAQNMLGYCYSTGTGIEQDHVCAVHWYHEAAAQNDFAGQYNLAYCYRNGLGVPRDLSLAAFWFVNAANRGHSDAYQALRELKLLPDAPRITGLHPHRYRSRPLRRLRRLFRRRARRR